MISGFPSPDVHRPIPEVIQQQLSKVGIALKIVETTDYSTTLKAVGGQLWLERGNQNDANPSFLPAFLFTSPAAGNKGDYALPFSVGEALDKPMAAALTTEDIPKTQSLTADALKAMIDDEVVIVPIAGIFNIWAHSKKVTGFKPHSAFVHTDFSAVSFIG
jgi:peptide/nickel transport system substrate-binding protein